MIVSDLSDPTVSTEELFLIFYCIIDDLYPEVTPDWVRLRNGADRMAMTDSEVITLSIMQEGQSNDSELSFHRVVQKDYLHLFPDLISRSRYHRRRKDLMGIQREMLRVLMNRLRLLAVWLALDSAPLTTAESPRWKSARMSIWAAEAGFAPSKQQFFLGFRLHLLVSNTGAICDFVLSPANVGERRVAEHMLAVEAEWQTRQARQAARSPKLDRCWPTTGTAATGSPASLAKRRGALVCAAPKPKSRLRRRSGASGLAPGLARSHRERLRLSGRSVPDRRDPGAVGLGRDDARRGEAVGLHGWLRRQRIARAPRNSAEEPLPVNRT